MEGTDPVIDKLSLNSACSRLLPTACCSMTIESIHEYLEYIVRLIRAEAYDNTVMETSMDDESTHDYDGVSQQFYPQSLDRGLGRF